MIYLVCINNKIVGYLNNRLDVDNYLSRNQYIIYSVNNGIYNFRDDDYECSEHVGFIQEIMEIE